jgi:hypothetical protein
MYVFTGRSALASRVSAIDDRQADTTPGNQKPSPRRVAQAGFVAASGCRHEQTDFKVIRDLAASGLY